MLEQTGGEPLSTAPYMRGFMLRAPRMALAAVVLGMAVVVGYVLGWERLWRPFPGGPATHPLTAVCFILLGLSALLNRPTQASNPSAALAFLAGTLAAVRMLTMATGQDDAFQAWSPFSDTLAMGAAAGQPISMGLGASIMIVLLAVGLCLVRCRLPVLSQVMAVAAAYPPLFAIVGYVYGVDDFRGLFSGMTLGMGTLCVGAVLGRTAHRGPLRSLLAAGSGGREARRQVLLLVGVCFALGFIATRSGFDQEARILAVETSVAVLAIVLVLLNATHRLDRAVLRRKDDAFVKPPLVADLKKARSRGEIFLVYQPQVNLADEEVVGVEALVRWSHPIRGLVSPNEFIPLAEAHGLINSLGSWVLEEACRQAASWDEDVLKGVAISVNVSPLQLAAPGFADMVQQIEHKTGLATERLILEITESSMVRDNERGFRLLDELRKRGVHIAIDDFGTGYSSLSYLRDLPSDYLKIDRSFVRDVPGKPEAEAIARAVVAVGKSLGYQIVAEGIETRQQADFLQSIWCDKGQGYLYAHPMRAGELADWARKRTRRVAETSPQHMEV